MTSTTQPTERVTIKDEHILRGHRVQSAHTQHTQWAVAPKLAEEDTHSVPSLRTPSDVAEPEDTYEPTRQARRNLSETDEPSDSNGSRNFTSTHGGGLAIQTTLARRTLHDRMEVALPKVDSKTETRHEMKSERNTRTLRSNETLRGFT